jgi:hypothetical protein
MKYFEYLRQMWADLITATLDPVEQDSTRWHGVIVSDSDILDGYTSGVRYLG